jgi:hypothetical protein
VAPFEVGFVEEMDVKKFFGELPNLQGEMSVENCLRIFDEQQKRMKEFVF